MGACNQSRNKTNTIKINRHIQNKKREEKKENINKKYKTSITNKKVKKDENVILECRIKDAPTIPEEVIDALRRSIARIETMKNKTFTGFFMKIDIKKKQLNFLLTCYHSISKKDIDSKITIAIYHGKNKKEEKTEIKLDEKRRLIKTYDFFDVTLIQILEEDNIKEKRYLFPDLNYINKGFNQYKDAQVYTAGYPDVPIYKGERHISSGIIKEINEFEFEHTCDTNKGSSGSPILNYNKDVIGIHYGSHKQKKINLAYFIGAIINELNEEKIQENNDQEKNNNPEINSNLLKKQSDKKNGNGLNENQIFFKIAFENAIPLLNNPKFLNNMKNMYSNPEMMNIMSEMPIIKENEFLSNEMKKLKEDPEKRKNIFNENNINAMKKPEIMEQLLNDDNIKNMKNTNTMEKIFNDNNINNMMNILGFKGKNGENLFNDNESSYYLENEKAKME